MSLLQTPESSLIQTVTYDNKEQIAEILKASLFSNYTYGTPFTSEIDENLEIMVKYKGTELGYNFKKGQIPDFVIADFKLKAEEGTQQ